MWFQQREGEILTYRAYHISGTTLVEQVYSELRCRLVEEHSHSMHNP